MSYSLTEMKDNEFKLFDDIKDLNSSLSKRDTKHILYCDNEPKGYFIIKVISQMNEFKLGNLLFDFNDSLNETILMDLINDYLHTQIIDNYVLKIITSINIQETNKIELLKKLGFIEDLKAKEIDGYLNMKLTKPIYLERNK